MKKAITVILLLVLFSSAVVSTSFAQESSDEAVVATQTDPIYTKERETEKIQELRILYRDQVQVYRNSERAYTIAKTNFEQVETLAALEEAVKATQTVYLDRSRVMITYLELIDAVLTETNGIELDLKDASHKEIVGLINLLKIHQESIQVSKDRDAMAILADEFEPIADAYESAVYRALSLIRIGKIQEVHDKAEIIERDIIAEHESQETTGLVTAKRERAYTQVERSFETINIGLIELFDSFTQKKESYSRHFYEKVLKDLGPLYIEISQSLDHLEELITL